MLRIFSRLGEICVCSLDQRVLIAMTELLGESQITVVLMFLSVNCTFAAVGIVLKRAVGHDETSYSMKTTYR